MGGKVCVRAAKRAVDAGRALPNCDLSDGIVTDDSTGTVTFHLVRPTPEFVYQLSLASASAVPQDTPTTLEPGTFLPATGPYRVASYTPKQDTADGHGRLELERNPYFREWSRSAQPDGYPDRIVVETGYSQKAAVARVADGRADLLWFEILGDADRLRDRFGSQLHTSAGTVRHVHAAQHPQAAVRRHRRPAGTRLRDRPHRARGLLRHGGHLPAPPAQLPGVPALLPLHRRTWRGRDVGRARPGARTGPGGEVGDGRCQGGGRLHPLPPQRRRRATRG